MSIGGSDEEEKRQAGTTTDEGVDPEAAQAGVGWWAGTWSLDATAEELARDLIFAMRGFRETVADRLDMRRLIALQVSLLLTALEADRATR